MSASETIEGMPWVAVGFGALDLRGSSLGADYDIVVTPVRPGPPLYLYGVGAEVWRRLVAGDVETLSADEEEIVVEMEQMGVASRDPSHRARVTTLKAPWLISPMHELVYALLGHVAAQEGVEIVFIKGPVLHAQGLRERAHSGDVDCWVPEADLVRFARAMQRWGWSPAFSAFTGTNVLHSLTLRAGEWGSAIDVHTWFPGMVMEPDEAFAVLRQETEPREFAGYMGRTPSPALHAIIGALHDLRPLQGRVADPGKVSMAAEMLMKGGAGTAGLVRRTHAEYALAETLSTAFPDEDFGAGLARVPRDWAWRLATSHTQAYVEAFKLIPPRDRVRVFLRVLWPTAESLRAGPMADDQASVNMIRLRRVIRGWSLLKPRREDRT